MELWCEGPAFLRASISEWPVDSCDLTLSDDDPEVTVTRVSHVAGVTADTHPLELLSCHYSDWYRLKRALAWLLRLKDKLRHKPNVQCGRHTNDEIAKAQLKIVKHVQEMSFEKEISAVGTGRPLSKSCIIRALDPVMGDDDMLRVGGRLRHCGLADSCKHPYIISLERPMARLIV